MRTFSLYNYIVSTIILVFSIIFAFELNMFGEAYMQFQIFLIAMLCSYSINEVWNKEYDNRRRN